MPTCRLLCLLVFPLLTVSAADDSPDEYLTQSKLSEPGLVSAPQSLPPDEFHVPERLLVPRMWAVMLGRLSTEQDSRLSRREDRDSRSKRVFCNGFTGCGGRFRGRRRQHPPVLLKRPFCNHPGCIGPRRSAVPSRAVAQKVMRLPNEIRKRLFCNAYDGCRGRKRALYSNWLSKLQGIAGDL